MYSLAAEASTCHESHLGLEAGERTACAVEAAIQDTDHTGLATVEGDTGRVELDLEFGCNPEADRILGVG